LLKPLPDGASLTLVRPLLATPRADIEAYCEAHGLRPRFDRSNLDRTYFRNRLRHEALPLLESLNPGIREVLRRSAEVAAADYEALEGQADAAWQACLLRADDQTVQFDRARWRELPRALQRATLRKAVWHLRRTLRDVTFVQVEDAVRVAAAGETGAQATLPAGLTLEVGYERLVIGGGGEVADAPDGPLLAAGEAVVVAVPGEATLSDGWRLTLEPYTGVREGTEWEALLADRWATPLDGAALGERVTLRARQPGDRFCPQGVGGSQKVAHFMVNAKIPARWRDRLPLLMAGEAIAWVAGWRVDERFTVTEATGRVVVARFDRPNGEGG
jgi:tRNA(Ile)-lysidine synthase